MTKSSNYIYVGIVVAIIASFLLYTVTQSVYGAVVVNDVATSNAYQTYEFFASTTAATGSVSSTVIATTTTATSTNITGFFDSVYGRYVDGSFDVRGAKKITMYFSRGGATHANTGSTVFKVQATRDGTNWTDVQQLVSATSTSVSNSLVQATASIGAATSTLVFGIDLDYISYKAIRCVVVVTTDGESSCAAAASF